MGADGEEKVGSRLDKLRKQGWFILHVIPIGEHGSDIDHVVIGPGGVFCINTKTHLGKKVWVGGNTVMVSGQRQPYVRNSRFEARRTAELLTLAAGAPVGVRPILAIMCAELAVKTQPEDVIVVGSRACGAVAGQAQEGLQPEGTSPCSTAGRGFRPPGRSKPALSRSRCPSSGHRCRSWGSGRLIPTDGPSYASSTGRAGPLTFARGGQQTTEAPAGP